MSQDRDDFAVIAQVTSPIIKKEALSQHVVYTVVGEDKVNNLVDLENSLIFYD